jgi:hypothetical protein
MLARAQGDGRADHQRRRDTGRDHQPRRPGKGEPSAETD